MNDHFPFPFSKMITFLCCTYHLEFSSSTYPLFRFIICFPWFTQDLLISKVSSTIIINSLHNVSSDFDLRTYNGLSSLPCISHITSFQQNNLIAWKGCPRCLHLKTKQALNSLLLLLLLLRLWQIWNQSHGLVFEYSVIFIYNFFKYKFLYFVSLNNKYLI